jgi:hypothetical protein
VWTSLVLVSDHGLSIYEPLTVESLSLSDTNLVEIGSGTDAARHPPD